MIPQLTILRGGFALMIVSVHLSQQFLSKSDAPFLYSLFDLGKHGVAGFFVLSAFLLTRGLLTVEPNSKGLRNYFFRRFVRIAPAYYVCVLVLSIFQKASVVSLVLHLVFLFNIDAQMFGALNYAFWSIAVEVMFYVLLPLLLKIQLKLDATKLIIGMIVLGLGWQFVSGISRRFFGFDQSLDWAARLFLVTALPAFAFGIALAMRDVASRRIIHVLAFCGLALVVLDVLLRLVGVWSSAATNGYLVLDSLLDGASGYFAYGGATFLLLNRDWKPIAWNSLSEFLFWTGERSFSLYLWHLPVAVVFASLFSGIVPAILAALFALLISHLSYKAIEKPASRYLLNWQRSSLP